MSDDARPRSETLFGDRAALNSFNEDFIAQARANAGEITSGPLAGAPAILVHVIGAKSGRTYTTPLVYTRDGDRLVIAASKGGAPEHPSWYHNLKAHPEVIAEVDGEAFTVRVSEVHGDERDRLYAAHAARLPQFDKYQARTGRTIPVLVLERI